MIAPTESDVPRRFRSLSPQKRGSPAGGPGPARIGGRCQRCPDDIPGANVTGAIGLPGKKWRPELKTYTLAKPGGLRADLERINAALRTGPLEVEARGSVNANLPLTSRNISAPALK